MPSADTLRRLGDGQKLFDPSTCHSGAAHAALDRVGIDDGAGDGATVTHIPGLVFSADPHKASFVPTEVPVDSQECVVRV